MMKRFLKSTSFLLLGFFVFIVVNILLDSNLQAPERYRWRELETWCYFFVFTLYPCFFSLISGIWFKRKNLFAGKKWIGAVILLSFVVNLFLFGWRYHQDVSFGYTHLYNLNEVMLIFPDSAPIFLSFLFTLVFTLSLLLSSYEKKPYKSSFLRFLFRMRLFFIYIFVVYTVCIGPFPGTFPFSINALITEITKDSYAYPFLGLPLFWTILALGFGIYWGYTTKKYWNTTIPQRLIMAGGAVVINILFGGFMAGVLGLIFGAPSTVMLPIAFFPSFALTKKKDKADNSSKYGLY